VLQAVYGDVKINMGNLSMGPLESPGNWNQRRNDNDDPRTLDLKGFNTFAIEQMHGKVVVPSAKLCLDNYSLEGKIDWRWSSPWLKELFTKDRARGLEECAEKVLACVTLWKKTNGSLPRYIHLFNEPTSGNREMEGASAEDIRDVVKAVGKRLQAEGLGDLRLIVPNEETVAHSIRVARVILADPEARAFVGAVGYHVYPYGSPYASVPRILHASGRGQPDAASVKERQELRDLCRQYGLPAWMTEVSHGETDPRSFEQLRGRAIHIHDEMVYADAAAFYGMLAFWDKTSHADHYKGRSSEPYLSEQDSIALADNDTGKVLITATGYAIGHYARWLKRGAVRLEAASPDPLVQVTAFADAASKRLILVIVVNAAEARTLSVSAKGLQLTGEVAGEQSTADRFWQALVPVPASADGVRVTLPPLSVTTLACPWKE
jgi:hypothetical protein